MIKQLNMTHSFSCKGSPYDNACIESFHAILKKEEVNHVQYIDFKSAELTLFQFIDGWYNRKRIHGSMIIKHHKKWEMFILVLFDVLMYHNIHSLHGLMWRGGA